MKTIEFKKDLLCHVMGYTTDTPGDQSGEYVRAEEVKALVEALDHIAMGTVWSTAEDMVRIAEVALKAVES